MIIAQSLVGFIPFILYDKVVLMDQITSFQTLISAVISAFIVIVGIFIKDYLDGNRSKRNYIIDNGYGVHERLRDNLRGLLRSDSYSWLMLPKNVSDEDKKVVNMSYASYKNMKEDILQWNEVTLYGEEFKHFEKELISDISKVSKLSVPRVQKIASQIEDLYDKTKAEESTLNDLFQDELFFSAYEENRDLTESEKSYIQLVEETHKKIFLVEVQSLLLKLEKEIERVVKLQL